MVPVSASCFKKQELLNEIFQFPITRPDTSTLFTPVTFSAIVFTRSIASWLGNLPLSETTPCLVFTLTLNALDTLFARISDFTLVVIQLSDTARSALLTALDGAIAASSDAACDMSTLRKSAATKSVVPTEIAWREILLRFWVVVIGNFQFMFKHGEHLAEHNSVMHHATS